MSNGEETRIFFDGDYEAEGNKATAISIREASQRELSVAPAGHAGGPSTPKL